ncbi:MAG: dUTP diphosphatase [Clostridia bacterium]|nr:dUTP diphosphatase [Clostridia bacterium]
MKVKVKKLKENARIPRCQTETAAAADLYACLDAPLLLLPGQRVKIPTGIAIDYEDSDVVAVICARSGISAKHGISLTNGIGVVDPDYRGELLVSVVNLSSEPYTFSDGDRVAQLMFLPIVRGVFEEAEELSETERGEGGFGSTGT